MREQPSISFRAYFNNLSYFTVILVAKGIIPIQNNSKVYRLSIDNSLLEPNESGVFLLEYPLSEEIVEDDLLNNFLDDIIDEKLFYTPNPLHILSNLIVEDFTRKYSLTNSEKEILVGQLYESIEDSLYIAIDGY